MDQILIDGKSYQLIARATATRKNTLPKHALEDGSTATDHIIIGQPTIDFNLILFPGEYATLEALSRYQKLFSVVTSQGTYQNVALASISDEYGRTANTTQCTVSLAVQLVTATKTVPTELGGTVLNPATAADAVNAQLLEMTNVATLAQMTEHYLNNKLPKWVNKDRVREELKKLAENDSERLLNTLIATGMFTENEMGTVANYEIQGVPRKKLDHDITIPTAASRFTLTDDQNHAETYIITHKTENKILSITPIGDATFSTDKTKHATITRISDGATMYNGPIRDISPFTMKDPDTGIPVATLQYVDFQKILYIE